MLRLRLFEVVNWLLPNLHNVALHLALPGGKDGCDMLATPHHSLAAPLPLQVAKIRSDAGRGHHSDAEIEDTQLLKR